MRLPHSRKPSQNYLGCRRNCMSFRFPLQAVLDFRRSIEHQEELRLVAANQLVATVTQRIEQLDHSIQQHRSEFSRALSCGTSMAEMQFAIEVESRLQGRRCSLNAELRRACQIRDRQQEQFYLARRQRETFELLRTSQLQEYQRNQNRRTQRLLDEMFLLRQARRTRG